MLLHRIHLLPACLPALQHSSGRWKCLCLLAPVPSRSLLPRHRAVEKSRQLHCHSAGSLPCTYPCMNGITWHSADPCAWNKGTWKREGIHAEKSALNCCINGHSRVQTPVWQKSAHSLEQMCNSMCTLTLRLAAPINIRCYFCFSLYSSYTKTQWHTGTFIRWQNTMMHTHTHRVHFAPCQCLSSLAYKWSEAAGLPSVTYFFSRLSVFAWLSEEVWMSCLVWLLRRRPSISSAFSLCCQ